MASEIRFSVQSADGTKRSPSWKVWSSAPGHSDSDDLYLACREIGSMHISFHEDEWHLRYERGFVEKHVPLKSSLHQNRSPIIWQIPPDHPDSPGLKLVFRIVIPGGIATHKVTEKDENKRIKWIPAPPAGKCQQVAIFYADKTAPEGGWPGMTSVAPTDLVGEFRMSRSRRRVYLVNRVVELPRIKVPEGPHRPTYMLGKGFEDLKQPGLRANLFGGPNERWVVQGAFQLDAGKAGA